MTHTSITPNQGIRNYRAEKGIKITDIVKQLGIPYRTLIAWETGYRKAAPYMIRLLKMYIDKMALEQGAKVTFSPTSDTDIIRSWEL